MATKQAFSSSGYDEAVSSSDYGASVRIRISGMREVEAGVFEIDGCTPRRIDHEKLAEALGCNYKRDDELMDKVLQAVWRTDMVRLLTDRIEV